MSDINDSPIFKTIPALISAPRSAFYKGTTSDWVQAREESPNQTPNTEPLFTQSNARVLLGHAANGSLRFVALPTSVYPAPTQTGEYGLGPGMYHHFDVAMYAGDLSYRILLEGSNEEIDLAADDRANETFYADYFLPLTTTSEGDLDILLFSLAPVAPDRNKAALTPAPLPGPPGVIYAMHLHNNGSQAIKGKVILQTGDLLLGHYEDVKPEMRPIKQPQVDLRQQTLILTRPEGSVGIHLHNGKWIKLDAPYQAEIAFTIAPGEDTLIETHIALGQGYSAVMEAVFALHLHSALDWVNFTIAFWRSRLGTLQVDAHDAGEHAALSRELHLRSIFDNFNCLQTDAAGNLIAHWQGAPSHGYGTVWGIDIEPTAVSVVHACPEIARQTMLFFMDRSRAPKGPPDHSIPILVAPVVIARQWLQVSGDIAFLQAHPEVMQSLESIMETLLELENKSTPLFPSRYSSDGVVGRRYDYGTNVKVYYTFDSMAYIWRVLGDADKADFYAKKAVEIQQAIPDTMTVDGPFGCQISGGTNLDEDPGTFYLPEDVLYYDGEDTSSMLAPVYAVCDITDPTWINYHRFARSLFHAGYDPEFDTLYWHPAEPAVFDGTAYFSRLGGSVTTEEMKEALETLQDVSIDPVTGSVFWWPHGLEYRRSLTRCSQGQGAWAWQYFQQWLGLTVDAPHSTLTFVPRGLLTHIFWPDFRSGDNRFSLNWDENNGSTLAVVRNDNPDAWTVQVGLRQPGAGALGEIEWQKKVLQPGETVEFTSATAPVEQRGFAHAEMAAFEAQALGENGVVFKRYGPALLWGHWEPELQWRWDVMPLALRFVVLNNTGKDWTDVCVTLETQHGWQAQGRATRHWSRPDHMDSGQIHLELGPLSTADRTAAAFWLKAPFDFEVVLRWEDSQRPFHAPSQPGEGLDVLARRIETTHETVFVACLSAKTSDGERIERTLNIPVKIIPFNN
jgi:hypothetical protein